MVVFASNAIPVFWTNGTIATDAIIWNKPSLTVFLSILGPVQWLAIIEFKDA